MEDIKIPVERYTIHNECGDVVYYKLTNSSIELGEGLDIIVFDDKVTVAFMMTQIEYDEDENFEGDLVVTPYESTSVIPIKYSPFTGQKYVIEITDKELPSDIKEAADIFFKKTNRKFKTDKEARLFSAMEKRMQDFHRSCIATHY